MFDRHALDGLLRGSDDQRFLMIRPLQPKIPDKIIVVENWLEELKTAASASSLGVR